MQRSVFIATSLDGYIARPDGGLDWLRAVERPGEDYGYAAFAATCAGIPIFGGAEQVLSLEGRAGAARG